MRTVWVLGLLLSSFGMAEAAVEFDSVSIGSSTVNSWSWSHTTSTSTERILIVQVGTIGNLSVTAVTYAGTAMTQFLTSTAASFVTHRFYYQLAPATGANNVAVTMTGLPGNFAYGGATSWVGVDQRTPVDASACATGNSSTATVTVNLTKDGSYVVDGLLLEDTHVVDPSQTQRYLMGEIAGSTKGPISPAAATTMTWTSGNFEWSLCAIGLMPVQPPLGWDSFDLLLHGRD